jgi:hypothetical protein
MEAKRSTSVGLNLGSAPSRQFEVGSEISLKPIATPCRGITAATISSKISVADFILPVECLGSDR